MTAAAFLLIPVCAVLVVFIRYAKRPAHLLAPIIVAIVVGLSVSLLRGGGNGILAALLIVAGSAPGWLWRRDAAGHTQRLGQLDDILAQARRGESGETGSAAAEAAAQLAETVAALGSIAGQVGARQVRIWDVDGDEGTARVRAAASGPGGQSVRLSGSTLGWVWEQDIRMRIDPAPHWATPGTVTVAERLTRKGSSGLLLTFDFDAGRVPGADDPSMVQAGVYVRGVIALHDERSSAAARERRGRTLLDSLDRMPSSLDLATLADELCRTAMAMTDATGAVLGRWDGATGVVIARAGADGGPSPGDEFHSRDSELVLAARAGDMIVRDAASWSLGRTTIANSEELWLRRPRSVAAVPLRRHGEGVSGVLAVWSSARTTLSADSFDMLRALAPFAAHSVERAHEFGSIKESADQDPLTELQNRRAFEQIFDAEAGRFTRHGRPLALLVVDLDHFKSINDRFGHEAGDEVLRRTARILDASVRDIDTAARFGGEEFVVLLPETGMRAALDVAERIRSAIAQLEVNVGGRAIAVTASVGVSSCPERVPVPGTLLGSADRALYQAKADGRNRVVAASI